MPKSLNIVWLKKDLRLTDHAPLHHAIAANQPFLILFCFEPCVQQSTTWSPRHWWFIHQALLNLQQELANHACSLYICPHEFLDTLTILMETYSISTIFSHEETGIAVTYERDQQVQQFCAEQDIDWQEFPQNGIIRALQEPKTWRKEWLNTMRSLILEVDFREIAPFILPQTIVEQIAGDFLSSHITHHHLTESFTPNAIFQKVEQSPTSQLLVDFVQQEQPQNSQLSPYLTYGLLSVRQVYQYIAAYQAQSDKKKQQKLKAFLHHLQKRCRNIQQFELEKRMELENQNRAFNGIRVRWNKKYYQAWQTGKTGFPLVDAAIRCVRQTGHLNFLLRAVLISFLSHHLWLDWRKGATFLAQHFLDFEPGVHYHQCQMIAGCTGIHPLQIYDPVQLAKKVDPTGSFIQKWVPELRNLPPKLCHAPWTISDLEVQLYNCHLGTTYPKRIVNMEQTTERAKRELTRVQNTKWGKEEGKRVMSYEL